MQDLGYELPRISIPRTWVNKPIMQLLPPLATVVCNKSTHSGDVLHSRICYCVYKAPLWGVGERRLLSRRSKKYPVVGL